jgi:predicted dienelactone hydrolase
MIKFRYHFLVLLMAACISVFACDVPVVPVSNTYDIGGSTNIKAVTVFYPSDIASSTGLYDTVTLSGGFSNTKEDMYWLANFLVQQNFIVFAVSAVNNYSVTNYKLTQEDCFTLILSENENAKSPVYHKIGKIGLIGYSMGGGAVLNAAEELGTQIDAVVALAPWGPSTELGSVTAPTLILVGDGDTVAPADTYAKPAYDNLPVTIDKACALIGNGFTHLDFNGDDDTVQHPAKVMVGAWLLYVLDGDAGALGTLTQPPLPVTYYNQNIF